MRAAFLFDVSEVNRLAHFGELFAISTFFACLDPAGSPTRFGFACTSCCLPRSQGEGGKPAAVVPFAQGVRVTMGRPFQDALRDVISLR